MKTIILKSGETIKVSGEKEKGSILVITNRDGDIFTRIDANREEQE